MVEKGQFEEAQDRERSSERGSTQSVAAVGSNIFKGVLTVPEAIEVSDGVMESDFRLLPEAMPQIVWMTRPDGWNIYFNQQWVTYTGLTLEESYGHGWNKPFHPDDQKRAWDAWQDATTNRGTYSLECRLRRADGAYKWWLIRGVPLYDSKGTLLKWFGTCTDIDEIKQAEEALRASEERHRQLADNFFASLQEKEILLREIHHRVKNNLNIVVSLLELQTISVGDSKVREALIESQNRINSIALIHESLYQSKNLARIDFSSYVETLVHGIYLAYGVSPLHIWPEIRINNFEVDIDLAIPCSLIINELVSNALKHAFVGRNKGHLKVLLEPLKEHSETYQLTVADDGVGMPADFRLEDSSSLGLKLIQTLSHQIGGTLLKNEAEKGTKTVIQFQINGKGGAHV